MVLHVDLVRVVRFAYPPVVGDVLAERLQTVDLEWGRGLSFEVRLVGWWGSYVVIRFVDVVSAVLLHEASRPVDVLLNRAVGPPLLQVTILVELSTCNGYQLVLGCLQTFRNTYHCRRTHGSARDPAPYQSLRSSAL